MLRSVAGSCCHGNPWSALLHLRCLGPAGDGAVTRTRATTPQRHGERPKVAERCLGGLTRLTRPLPRDGLSVTRTAPPGPPVSLICKASPVARPGPDPPRGGHMVHSSLGSMNLPSAKLIGLLGLRQRKTTLAWPKINGLGHCLDFREAGAGGSNPLTPTNEQKAPLRAPFSFLWFVSPGRDHLKHPDLSRRSGSRGPRRRDARGGTAATARSAGTATAAPPRRASSARRAPRPGPRRPAACWRWPGSRRGSAPPAA